mmetsp:Transcript_6819/g.18879  ORF Transcript_6819/g.18879 Transcript_6819/m.18879 type:complete len:271 (-) Transcript_6819:67-879(-)
MEEADSVHVALSESDDAPRADRDASLSDALDRVQPIFVLPSRGDLLVVLGRRVQVVIVGGQTRLTQLLCLLRRQHPERRAHLHIKRTNLRHSIQHPLPLPLTHLRRAPPRRTHAEARRPRLLRPHRRLVHVVQVHQLLRLGPRLFAPVARLTAVVAVLGTPARLDRQQRAPLHHARVVVRPVHPRRAMDQLQERHLVDALHLFPGPIGADVTVGSPVGSPVGSRVGSALVGSARRRGEPAAPEHDGGPGRRLPVPRHPRAPGQPRYLTQN